ncbi:hypothetical protein ACH492_31985 [Streptomyces sp. NPDC019443]|uniref:hypothetical protein n=1 Tax=Streptomyces sp. NPDC019443 TaxID=3365061 RepID=UPI0037972122
MAWGAPVRTAAGSLLEAGPAVRGVRTYVAFAGGIAVDPVLGSRSTDLLSGLGLPPAPIRARAHQHPAASAGPRRTGVGQEAVR